jgi:glycosyltransferase involved in cell wall biosynthesis
MRITVLWSALAGYSVAFLRELAVSENCRLQLIYQEPEAAAPYEGFDLSFCEDSAEDSPAVQERLEERVQRFSPDCIVMNGWAYPHFMRIARKMRRRGAYVIAAMDNQWRGTLKQYLGILSAPWLLKPAIDTFLVAGERQAQFARKLGYEQVLHGYAAAEVERFTTSVSITLRPRAFLFVGRLISVKNLPRLVEAYRLYRERAADPWTLVVAGAGPLAPLFAGVEGVELLGFVQPSALPEATRRARCLVLPSTFDQWGVVIHEAAAAGLPVIASYRCGAVTAFVRDGVNGFVVTPGAESSAAAMVRVAQSANDELRAMSQASTLLAGLWTPRKLAAYLCAMLRDRVGTKVREASPAGDGPSARLAI